MRYQNWFALVLPALLACGNSPPPPAVAALIVDWSLDDGTGDYSPCATNETVSVVVGGGSPLTASCESARLTVGSLTAGVTSVTVQLLDASGQAEAGASTTQQVTLVGGTNVMTVTLQVAPISGGGSMLMTWSLSASGTAVQCNPDEFVGITLTGTQGSLGELDFNCADGAGGVTINGLTPDTYTVQGQLYDGSATAEGSPSVAAAVVVQSGQTQTVVLAAFAVNSR